MSPTSGDDPEHLLSSALRAQASGPGNAVPERAAPATGARSGTAAGPERLPVLRVLLLALVLGLVAGAIVGAVTLV